MVHNTYTESRNTRITLDGLLRGKITIMLKIKKFSNPFLISKDKSVGLQEIPCPPKRPNICNYLGGKLEPIDIKIQNHALNFPISNLTVQ